MPIRVRTSREAPAVTESVAEAALGKAGVGAFARVPSGKACAEKACAGAGVTDAQQERAAQKVRDLEDARVTWARGGRLSRLGSHRIVLKLDAMSEEVVHYTSSCSTSPR